MLIGVDGNEANVVNRVGSGVYTHQLLKQFHSLSLPAKRSNLFQIFLKEKPQADLPGQTANFKYKVFGPTRLWTQFALPLRLILGPKPNVFFSPAHYGPRFSRAPYVVTIHDLSYIHYPELFNKDDLYQLTSWSKYSILHSAHIITPSKSTKDDIVKNYSVDPSKITVTYEGYNKQNFKPQSAAKISTVKKKYKIQDEYLIFVGTLQPRKNVERLIEAFALILSGNTPGVSLVIVGKKGWMYDQILSKSKDLGIEKSVIFTDFVPDEDLSALISGSQLYINPSLWEGFGIPVIEAQACGVPVAISNTSSLPEIITPPGHPELVSGSLFDPTDTKSIAKTLEELLTDEKKRSDLVKRGLENAKRYSWEKCAKETIEVLTKVAS